MRRSIGRFEQSATTLTGDTSECTLGEVSAVDDDAVARIRARWSQVDADSYEARVEGDEVRVYGPLVRRSPETVERAIYCAAGDVATLLRLLDERRRG
ncbi:MAG: hypothetical protein IT378_10015 [Sandaracinaceae bacterium]|nr:hypothetical protein [Sandaracinaceae bacterium]